MHDFVTWRVACVASALYAVSAAAQPQSLGSRLASGDQRTRAAALAEAARIPPQQVSADIRSALNDLLSREAAVHVARARQDAHGGEPVRIEDPDFIGAVARVVISLHDRASVPALASAMFLGSSLSRELARWGDDGATAVLGSMANPDMPSATTHDGLIALRMLVEGARTRPLSAATRARIRALAQTNLAPAAKNDEYGITLRRSIDLAVALGDADLRATVTAIAASAEQVRVRGIRADRIASIQAWAADRLRGVPPLPRPQ